MKLKVLRGSQAGLFDDYEWAKLLHISTLVYMVLTAVVTWGLTYVIPVVEGWGGAWAAVTSFAVPLIRAWLLKRADNTSKTL
jgi:hypothetical protein